MDPVGWDPEPWAIITRGNPATSIPPIGSSVGSAGPMSILPTRNARLTVCRAAD